MTQAVDRALDARLRQTLGRSADPIHAAAADALRRRGVRGHLVDLGCGTGRLRAFLDEVSTTYLGVDAMRHAGFPAEVPFLAADLNRTPIALPNDAADAIAAVETIEHLENPRAFCREIVRLLKPGGWLVVTTPNQRSAVSLGSLLVKGHFAEFQDNNYPAHQTALLDTDLRRIAAENGLDQVAIEFTHVGRVPFTARHYPSSVARVFPRVCSDNVLLVARKRP